MKRLFHTATAIAVSSSQVVVVVCGGLDEFIRYDCDDSEQPMKAATVVLEFGNDIIFIVGAHPHSEMICVFVGIQSCSRVGVVRRNGV